MLLTPQIEYFLKKNSVTLTDHGNALCSSVVLLHCYPCDKCHGFYNATVFIKDVLYDSETSFSIHLFYWLCGQLDKGGIHSIRPNNSP